MNDYTSSEFLGSPYKLQINIELHSLLLQATFPKFTQILHHGVVLHLIVQTGEEAQGSGRIPLSGHPGPRVKQEEPKHSQSQCRAVPTSLPMSRGSFCKRVLLSLLHLEVSPWERMWRVWYRNALEVTAPKLYLLYFWCISTSAISVE